MPKKVSERRARFGALDPFSGCSQAAHNLANPTRQLQLEKNVCMCVCMCECLHMPHTPGHTFSMACCVDAVSCLNNREPQRVHASECVKEAGRLQNLLALVQPQCPVMIPPKGQWALSMR